MAANNSISLVNLDFDTLKKTAEKVGFDVELIHEEDQQYLAELTVK